MDLKKNKSPNQNTNADSTGADTTKALTIMDINKLDAAGFKPCTSRFKCLTNTGPTTANTVHIKNRFNKLTLSSSNKKKSIPHERPVPSESGDETPTPKMLTYSSGSSDSSDIDDDHQPADEQGNREVEPIVQSSSMMVNRLLESSPSLAESADKEDAVAATHDHAAPEQFFTCEAPSFSQRLEVTDADETHCTLLNEQRISGTGDPIFNADTIVGIIHPTGGFQRTSNYAITNLSMGTEMERLQITASSEDLFEERSPKSDQYPNESSSSNIPVAQSKMIEEGIISNLSMQVERIELAQTSDRNTKKRRETIMTISSSQSSPESVGQLSTRSSLASEEVYDVITLSDSETGGDDGADQSSVNLQPPLNGASPAAHYNLSLVQSQSLGSDQMPPVVSDLSSLAQNRLDRFFDNIPLISSKVLADKSPCSNNSLNQSALVSDASSVCVIETDEEDVVAMADPVETRNATLDDSIPPDIIVDISDDDDDVDTETPQVPQTLSSELVPTTQYTPLSSSSSKVSKKSSHRTPVVNISAKFQIRIQVAQPQNSSSECSASSNNTSPRSSFSSEEPQEPKNDDTLVNKQAARMSELVISDSNPSNTKITKATQKSTPKPATSISSTPRKTKINCPQYETSETPKSRGKTTPRNVSKNLPQMEANHTPKSNTKKPQLSKLRTPNLKPAAGSTNGLEDGIGYLSPPKTVNPSLSKIVLDDADQQLLNELYGVSWQTPDLLKKCVLRRRPETEAKKTLAPPKVTRQSSEGNEKAEPSKTTATNTIATNKGNPESSRISHDFSMFRKNIANHLDSTRIEDAMGGKSCEKVKTVKTKVAAEQVVASPFFKKPCATKASPKTTDNKKKAVGEIDTKSSKKSNSTAKQRAMPRPKKTGWQRIVDSDSDSELSDDTDSDAITEDLSDRYEDDPVPTKTVRILRDRKKINQIQISDGEDDKENNGDEYLPNQSHGSNRSQKSPSELTYLDLTHAEVVEDEEHQAPDASDQDLEVLSRKLLQDFEFKKPSEFQHTPAPPSVPFAIPATPITTTNKTKRKLFTPYFDDVQQATEEIYQKHKITPPKNDRLTIMDQNDDESGPRVQFRSGVPAFLLPKNKRVDDLRNEDVAERSPSTPKSNDSVPKTPTSTPKTQRKVKEVGTPKLPSTVAEIPKTPANKYGFLRSFDVHLSKNLIHPTALIFRDKFKTKKEELTSLLYAMYNEQLFGGRLDVPVTWNKKLKTTAGYCYSRRRMGIRTAAVDLSDKVITSGDRLRCTLIHELCHAATWIFNADRGHGATWKTWAAKANMVFPDLPAIERCHTYDIEYKYTYQCTLCGAKSHAHSKSKKVELIRCAYCHGAIEIFLNKKDKDGAVCPTPVRKATGFAAFVKETYKEFKSAGVQHAEVMRQISAKYASLSAEEKKKY